MSTEMVARRTCDNDECRKVWIQDPTDTHRWNFGWVLLENFLARGIESSPSTRAALDGLVFCSQACCLKTIEQEMWGLS